MKVKKLMTTDVEFCRPEDDLVKPAAVMWQRDCGVVPVLDDEMRVAAVITDRDICIASASLNRKPSEIKVREVIGDKKAVTCSETDDIETALRKMRKNKVKRLPVVSENGSLAGILSVTDILLKSGKLKKEVLSTLKAISTPHRIVLTEISEEQAA